MNRYQYSLLDAKLFSKFPGTLKGFARYLRKEGYLKHKNEAYDEYVRHGWFSYVYRKNKTKSGQVVKKPLLIVTEKGIGLLQWLVASKLEELKVAYPPKKRKKKKKNSKTKIHGTSSKKSKPVRGTGPSTELPN